MTITLLLRAPGTGYSIEELFGSIGRELAQQPGVQVNTVIMPHVSRGLWSVWRNIRFVNRLRKETTDKTTLFHITGDVHYVALALPPTRTVLTIHDAITLTKNRNRPLRYMLFRLLWFYWPLRRAAVVTAVSEQSRHRLRRHVGRVANKVVVVPNAVDPVFSYRPRLFDTDCPVLLHLGTAPHKNLNRLIDAIEGLVCRLLIVGPITDELLVDMNRRGIIYQHYSDLSQIEVVQLYDECDIVAFVSTYEGFGMPILEANAMGRVVLASNRSPMREVAGGAALLVDPTSTESIRMGIQRLIHDEAHRHELILAGRQNAMRYSLERITRDYLALYASMQP